MNAATLIALLKDRPDDERRSLAEWHGAKLTDEDRAIVEEWLVTNETGRTTPYTELELSEDFGERASRTGTGEVEDILARRLIEAVGGDKRSGWRQLGDYFNLSGANPDEKDVAKRLAESLPDWLRRNEVLDNADLRAVLRKAQDEGVISEDEYARYAPGLREQAEVRLVEYFQSQPLPPNTTPDQYASMVPELVNEVLSAADDGRIEMLPLPAGAEEPGGGAAQEEYDIFALEASGNNRRLQFMRREEIAQLLQSGEIDLMTVSNNARQLRMEAEAAGIEVQGEEASVWVDGEYTEPVTGPVGSGGEYSWARASGKEVYTITETLALPAEMNQREMMQLHTALLNAGIYDLASGEPNTPGDPTDQRFKAAWRELARMSLEKNESMMSILHKRRTYREDELASARGGRYGTELTDPARLRLNGDSLARQLLGRKLRDDEHESMVNFIHDLERKNAEAQAGLTPDDRESTPVLDEAIIADIDAQMQERIINENPVESGAHDVADQYDVFSALIRGPGRGVG